MQYSSPQLVNELSLQRAANLGGQQQLLLQPQSQIGGATPLPAPPLPTMQFPSFSWPSFSFFEVLIIVFAVWIGFELYRRYQLQKERFRREGRPQKSKNIIDVIYDFITDRREYYDENLDYLN